MIEVPADMEYRECRECGADTMSKEQDKGMEAAFSAQRAARQRGDRLKAFFAWLGPLKQGRGARA